MSRGRRGLRVGLTGGFACGKSEVGRVLRELGAEVADADDLAHEAMRAGTPAFGKVVARFGRGIVGCDGEIDRAALGQRVFARAEERRALEALVHPEVIRRLEAWVEETAGRGRHAVAIVPLLHEAGLAGRWDAVVCVTAPEAAVLDRAAGRGLSAAAARARIAAQLPVEEKAGKADYVIRNDGTLDALRQRAREVWAEILKKERMRHG